MPRAKTLADALTGARFLLGLYLLWLGSNSGPEAMPTATLVLLVAWSSDLLDGPLARRDVSHRQTWIGDHDLEADLTVALGVWVYLTLAGYIPFYLALAYGAASAAALWHFGSAPLAWGLQAIPYAAMIRTAWRVVPLYGLLLALWVSLAVVATWPRFPQQVVPEFIRGMRGLLRRRS